ncbi:MAG TPA: DUF1003 domain-containing protein [Candidatus Saccharimonadia bacterium]|jgi:uncharacterized membrane protein
MALINPNLYIKQFRDFEDKAADAITSLAGNMNFVYFHAIWFGVWIAAGLGLLGVGYEFDKFPFGLLTMIVSLEAIFLSTFVMISQNRAADKSEIRSQLDYETDVQSEREIAIIMRTLVRLADKQGVDIKDLTSEMESVKHLAKNEADRRAESRARRRQREKEVAAAK